MGRIYWVKVLGLAGRSGFVPRGAVWLVLLLLCYCFGFVGWLVKETTFVCTRLNCKPVKLERAEV